MWLCPSAETKGFCESLRVAASFTPFLAVGLAAGVPRQLTADSLPRCSNLAQRLVAGIPHVSRCIRFSHKRPCFPDLMVRLAEGNNRPLCQPP
jgi:hypothetical protein